jgi:hypothetical protein
MAIDVVSRISDQTKTLLAMKLTSYAHASVIVMLEIRAAPHPRARGAG